MLRRGKFWERCIQQFQAGTERWRSVLPYFMVRECRKKCYCGSGMWVNEASVVRMDALRTDVQRKPAGRVREDIFQGDEVGKECMVSGSAWPIIGLIGAQGLPGCLTGLTYSAARDGHFQQQTTAESRRDETRRGSTSSRPSLPPQCTAGAVHPQTCCTMPARPLPPREANHTAPDWA